jgi:hypothetical protein
MAYQLRQIALALFLCRLLAPAFTHESLKLDSP